MTISRTPMILICKGKGTFDPQMYDKSIIAATFLISLLVTIFLSNTFKLILLDSVFAQVKGGLSTSLVNPNSTIGERTGNTTADLLILPVLSILGLTVLHFYFIIEFHFLFSLWSKSLYSIQDHRMINLFATTTINFYTF